LANILVIDDEGSIQSVILQVQIRLLWVVYSMILIPWHTVQNRLNKVYCNVKGWKIGRLGREKSFLPSGKLNKH
jgi:hypothetical protein